MATARLDYILLLYTVYSKIPLIRLPLLRPFASLGQQINPRFPFSFLNSVIFLPLLRPSASKGHLFGPKGGLNRGILLHYIIDITKINGKRHLQKHIYPGYNLRAYIYVYSLFNLKNSIARNHQDIVGFYLHSPRTLI